VRTSPDRIEPQKVFAPDRTIQLDFFHRHGVNSGPNRETLAHELLDLNYTNSAPVGGTACVRNEHATFQISPTRRFRVGV
jgi:hypothetical protein